MSAADDASDVREIVRRRYAAAAVVATTGDAAQARLLEGPNCGDTARSSTCDDQGGAAFGADLYNSDETAGANAAAVAASLGCGVPTAVADLHAGETVLDLGSGAGADVLISARRVGPTGKVIGLDMTTEMLQLARCNAAEAGATNVEFIEGYLEDIPLPDASVDVVLSNCVINLAADKNLVLREAARVLRPGGRLAISDVIADPAMDEATRNDMKSTTGCIAGALTSNQYRATLTAARLTDIQIIETHRVHSHAASAIIHANKRSE